MTDIKLKKIMVALAMNGDEERVIGKAVEISEGFGSSLIVVHVNDIHAGKMSMMMDSIGHKYTEPEIMDMLMARNSDLNTNSVQIQILTSEDIPEAVSMAIVEGDLLILGHKKMNIVKEKLSDSLDQQIVNKVNCHSLVIPI